jgi:hypothetical protein
MQPDARPRAGRFRTTLALAGLALLILAALPFVWHSIARGLSLSDEAERAASRFVHGDGTDVALYGHMVVGGLLTLLVPLQLLGPVRRRWPGMHRWTGRAAVALALATAAGGLIYIAAHGTVGGPWMSANFALYGLLLGATAWMAAARARAREPSHPEWAVRFLVLALGSWIFRVMYGLWVLSVGEVAMRPDFSGAFDRVAIAAFYLLPLALAEVGIRRRRAARGPRGRGRGPRVA